MNRIIEAPQGRLFEHDTMPGADELSAEPLPNREHQHQAAA
jgi:hypothetical protein